MKLTDIADIVAAMDNFMPQSSRALLAHRLLKLVMESATGKIPDDARSEIVADFIGRCKLRSGQPHVAIDLNVNETDLAAFCNRWMNVVEYREPGTEQYQPITPEMHSIRYTMVQELKALHESQKEQESQESPSES